MFSHCPGRYPAHVMALDAVVFQNRCNVSGVGGGRLFVGVPGGEVDQAAGSLGNIGGQCFPGEVGIQCVPQVIVGGFGFLGLVMQTVVNGTPVDHLPGLRIDDEGL